MAVTVEEATQLPTVSPAAVEVSEEAVPAVPTLPTFTLEDVRKHKTEKSCWLVVHGLVHDVTDFLEEHPGGYDIILQSTGKDSTQDYDEIGHSNHAKKILEKYVIGLWEGGDIQPASTLDVSARKPASTSTQQTSGIMRAIFALLPVLLLIIAVALNVMSSHPKASE
ncbi:MAG: hypothetical protein WDW36_003415 [Sanguina aurantia]